MARQPRQPLGQPGARTVTTIHDPQGDMVYEGEFATELVQRNGGLVRETRADNIILDSGEAWNASMAAGAQPVMLVSQCARCRRRGRRGLVRQSKIKYCCCCGIPVCPRCRHRSQSDRKIRCHACHRRHRLGLLIRALFMERIDP